MKILLVATSYPRFLGDSAAIFLRYFAQAIGHRGHEVHVLVPGDPMANDSLTDERVTVHRFEYFAGNGKRLAYGSGILPNLQASRWLYLQVPFFLLSFFFSLLRLARRMRPDVIHAHWIIPTGFIAILVGKLLKIPVVTTVHGGDAFSLQSPMLQWLKRFTLRNSASWTANTHSTADAASSDADIAAPTVIPMGVDVDLFSSGNRSRYRTGLSEGDQAILFVGRLVKKKGCEVLIRAFQLVASDCVSRVVLWIVGDGEEKSALENLANELGLSEAVKFLGTVPNDRLPRIYAGADLFVVPSIEDSKGDTEGQGVVILEAMAAGTEIVASQVGGVEEVVDDKVTGWLVEPGNPDALAKVIRDRLNAQDPDSDVFDSDVVEQARKKAQLYNWPEIGKKFIDLYKKTSNHSIKSG